MEKRGAGVMAGPENRDKTRDKTLNEVRSRTKSRPPPKGFEPLKAKTSDLLHHGLPTEPDQARAPERHAFWSKLVSGPLNFVDPQFDVSGAPEPHRIAPPRRRTVAGTRHEKSLNWSGVYIKPSGAGMFTEIHGEWIVPKPSPATSGSPKLTPGSYRCVSFIGLDGQRRYRNSSLPQIGTASHVDVDAKGNATEDTYAWWQWWVPDHRQRETRISSVPIKPFDTVMCSLVVISPTIVRVSLKNQTTGYFFGPINYEAPTPEGSSTQLKVTGATAEWITERPTAFDAKHTLYELPDYGEVKFSNCHAVSSSPQFVERTQTLRHATVIKMRAIRRHPHRSVPVSIARIDGAQEFTTSYVK
jgi:hypothetical protein